MLRGAQDGYCLERIKEGLLEHMMDDTEFAKEDCCHYVYFVDFEEKVLEFQANNKQGEKVVKEVKFEDLEGTIDRLSAELWPESDED